MKFIASPQKYAVYLLCFSLNFETMNLFNLGIDYLAYKISIIILLFTSLLQYKSYFSIIHYSKYLIPIFLYFILLTFNNILYRTPEFNKVFYTEFFLNIITLIILCNYSIIRPDILLRGLFVFALSTIFLTLLYFSGIEFNINTYIRPTIFDMNVNELGIKLAISIFILSFLIFDNKLGWGKSRYLLFLFFPLLLKFLVDTSSRVAFISFILGSYVMFRFYYKFPGTNKKMNFFFSGLILALLVVIILFINMDLITRLIDTFTKGDLSGREDIWSSLMPVISRNIYFGIGDTGYAHFYSGGSPHNVFIEALCTTGIFGLILFLVFQWMILSEAYLTFKYQRNILPIVLMIPIMGVLLSAQFLNKKILWIVIAYVISYNVNKIQNKGVEHKAII